MTDAAFAGFPGIARGTVIPNVFFAAVLPKMESAAALLAFLWVSRLAQEQRGDVRCVTAGDVWAAAGARESFEALAGGRPGLNEGLRRCAALGALLGVELATPDGVTTVYFLNNPPARRAVARARAGELELKPGATPRPPAPEARPGIFRLYEENIGTITPLVGERLLAAVEEYPAEWVEEAFREAAELNRRNWRYIERILQNWAQEGRGNETAGRDTFEERKRRYLG